MKLFLIILTLLISSQLWSSEIDSKKCHEQLKAINTKYKQLGEDWRIIELSELEKECSKVIEVTYWKASALIERFQFLAALEALKAAKKNLQSHNRQSWLHDWVEVREKQAKYYLGYISKDSYLKVKGSFKSNSDIAEFIDGSIFVKSSYDKIAKDFKSNQYYQGVILNEEYADSEARAQLRSDIRSITKDLPVLREALLSTQFIIAENKEQMRKWIGSSPAGSVLGHAPEWAEKPFVMIINQEFIKNGNITLIHELLHVFVRLNPSIHLEVLELRHSNGHYSFPKQDSEHFFVYAGQFYLTGFSDFYEKEWPTISYVLKKAFGENRTAIRGANLKWVEHAFNRDKVNFNKL